MEAQNRARTQVAIVGGGPAGLLLGRLLHREGIDTVVLERKDRAYVEARIRAGILEQGTVSLLREAGVADRMEAEALVHHGIEIALEGERRAIDFQDLVGSSVVVWGQTEVTRDLIAARVASGAPLVFEAEEVGVHDVDTDRPFVTYRQGGRSHRLDCAIVAGCDGFHGVCRSRIPAERLRVFERTYPFGWLGILAETPPAAEDLIYARHHRGFALFSMRSRTISRNYLQCRPDEDLGAWPDERIWSELQARLNDDGRVVRPGPILERSVTPMRSFVAEPMRHGRLFLAGDAAHIVPPTGAKGLNLAAGDVHHLWQALRDFFRTGDETGLDAYSDRALDRIWKAQRFSWWMTQMLHTASEQDDFENRVREAELAYVLSSRAARTALAENYVGLPF